MLRSTTNFAFGKYLDTTSRRLNECIKTPTRVFGHKLEIGGRQRMFGSLAYHSHLKTTYAKSIVRLL